MVELSAILALLGGFVGLAGWLSGRDKRLTSDAEWKGTVNAKLDIVVNMTHNMERLENTVHEHGERLSAVESSAKQAHHRIDTVKESIDKMRKGV